MKYSRHTYDEGYMSTNLLVKRLFDLFFSCFVVLFVLIWLIPIVGILVKLSSPGPVLEVRVRAGRKYKPILVFSFRTTSTAFEATDFTTFGRFLYKTGLDRIPEFLNVMFGDLSVVGPTQLPFNDELVGESNFKRYTVRPGIVSLAEVRGASIPEEAVAYDQLYINKYSFWLDIKIMFWALSMTLTGKRRQIYRKRTIKKLDNILPDFIAVDGKHHTINLSDDIWPEEIEEKNQSSERAIDVNTVLAVAAGGGMLLGSILSSLIGVWGIVAGVLIGGVVGYLSQVFSKYGNVIHPTQENIIHPTKKVTSH